MNQRLPKSERIRRRADYLRIQDSGYKIHTQNFVCFSLQPTGAGGAVVRPVGAASSGDPPSAPARVGITVSRRVGGAVVRNRVKRLVKEAFRRHKSELPRELELVVIARADAAKIGFVQVERELLDVSRRILSGRSHRSRLPPSGQ